MKEIPTTIKNKELVEKRREQIVMAAIKLFSKKGFHKTNLRELSKEAGLSYGNIYDYVGTKEDILFLLHDYCAGHAMNALKDGIKDLSDPVEKLRRIIRAEFKFMDQLSDAILLIYQESHILSKEYLYKLLQKEREHLEIIEQAISESIDHGKMRKCNVRLTANIIKSMIDAWVIKRWDLNGYADRMETEKLILDIIFDGLFVPEKETGSEVREKPRQFTDTSVELKGQSALIVNASTLIGTGLCNDMASRGAQVACCFDPSTLDQKKAVIADHNLDRIQFYPKKENGPLTLVEMFQKIEKSMERIDVYIHDIGIGTQKMKVPGVNVDNKLKYLENNLREAEEVARQICIEEDKKTLSRIIFIAPWALDEFCDPIRFEVVKAGTIALTKVLAKKVADKDINVNCIVPGYIKSGRRSKLEEELKETMLRKIPKGYLGERNDINEALRFLTSDSAKYITGQILYVSGGMS